VHFRRRLNDSGGLFYEGQSPLGGGGDFGRKEGRPALILTSVENTGHW
jgi:hypothetical protein